MCVLLVNEVEQQIISLIMWMVAYLCTFYKCTCVLSINVGIICPIKVSESMGKYWATFKGKRTALDQ